MSFDLIAWKRPTVRDEDDAKAIVDRLYASRDRVNPDVFEPSEDLVRFYDELLARYPALEALDDTDERLEESPWSMTPDRSDRVIEMSLRWKSPDEALDAIVELARKHGLVLYDPQGPSIHSPEQEPLVKDIAAQARLAAIAGGFGLLLIACGIFIPYWFVRWPMIGAGVFLAAMAIYALVILFVKPEWYPQ